MHKRALQTIGWDMIIHYNDQTSLLTDLTNEATSISTPNTFDGKLISLTYNDTFARYMIYCGTK